MSASKLWTCVCGGCDPDAPDTHLYNCGRCGYLALSLPYESWRDDDGLTRTEAHACPVCGEGWWLHHETWSRMRGHWTRRTPASTPKRA